MNKKLITLAVGVALAAPMAAHAGPKVYGDAHGAIGQYDADEGGAADKSTFVSSASSAWGIKGSDKLGNGMSAVYKFEWNVSLTGATAKDVATRRDRYVGLKAGWGTVTIGYYNTPTKIVGRQADLFFSRQSGENRSLTRRIQTSAIKDGAGGSNDERWQNIQYASPKVNGFQGWVMYSPDTDADDQTDDDRTQGIQLRGQYKNGPVMVQASWMERETATAGAPDANTIRIGGSYKMGDLKIVGLWEQAEDQGNATGRDRDLWSLGAAYKMGNNTFKIAYTEADDVDGTSNTGADLLALGIDHKLGKKTIVYATYAKIDNDTDAQYGLGGYGFDDRPNVGADGGSGRAGVAGADPTAFTVGMRHRF